MMVDHLPSSFIQSLTNEGPPFDAILNDHFTNDVAFYQADPATNSYLTGFLMAIFCAMIQETVFPRIHATSFVIEDVLTRVLDENQGIKSVTVINQSGVGEKILLVQNFHFHGNAKKVKNSGLSDNERQNIQTLQIGGKFIEKTVDYLLYNVGREYPADIIHRQTTCITYLYVERMKESNETRRTALLPKFTGLSHFTEIINQIRNVSATDVLVIKKYASIVLGDKTGNISDPSIDGFLHGTMLSRRSFLSNNVKVFYSENIKIPSWLRWEELLPQKSDKQISQPIIFYPNKDNLYKKAGNENFLASLIKIVISNSNEIDHLVLRMVSDVIEQALYPDKTYKKDYINTFLFGMLYAQHVDMAEVKMSKGKDQISSQIFLELVKKKRMIVFNFEKAVGKTIDTLKLKNFAQGRCYSHVFVITILEIEHHCIQSRRDDDKRFELDFHTIQKKCDHYPQTSTYHNFVKKDRFLNSILDLHSTYNTQTFLSSAEEFFRVLYNNIRLIMNYEPATIDYFLEGMLHHMKFLGSREVNVSVHRSQAAHAVRLETLNMVTLVNFVKTDFFHYFKMHVPKSASRMRLLTFSIGYNKRTDDLNILALTKLTNDDHEKFLEQCFNILTKEATICPIRNHHDGLVENPVFPEYYRTYLRLSKEVQQYELSGQETDVQKPTGVIWRAVRPIIDLINIPKHTFLDYYTAAGRITGTINEIHDNAEKIKAQTNKLAEKIKKSPRAEQYKKFTKNIQEHKFVKRTQKFARGIRQHRFVKRTQELIRGIQYNKYIRQAVNLRFVKAIQGMKLAKNLVRFTAKGYTMLTRKIMPVLDLVLGFDVLVDAAKAIKSGDTSAHTIFNLVSAIVGIVTGLLSMLTVLLGPVDLAISLAFFFIGNAWNAAETVEHISSIVSLNSDERIIQIFRLTFLFPVSEYIQNDVSDTQRNQILLDSAVSQLENSFNTKNVFLSASCFSNERYRSCRSILLDLRGTYRMATKAARTGPRMDKRSVGIYDRLCTLTNLDFSSARAQDLELPWSSLLDKDPIRLFHFPKGGLSASYACNDIIGVGRKSPQSTNVNFHKIAGSATIYTMLDTVNILHLSRGQYCFLVGGDRMNVFKFLSIYKVCYVEGGAAAQNTIDLSAVLNPYIKYRLQNNHIEIKFENRKRTFIRHIYYKQIDNFILSANNNKSTNIECFNGKIELKKENAKCRALYPVTLSDTEVTCRKMRVVFESDGCLHLVNNASIGSFIYTFDNMAGSIKLDLKDACNVKHKVQLKFLKIVDAKNLEFHNKRGVVYVNYVEGESTFTITMNKPAKSLRLTFGDDIHVEYRNERFFTEILSTEKSIGRLWYENRKLLETFDRLNIDCIVYTQKYDQGFIQTNGSMFMQDTSKSFKISTTREEDLKEVRHRHRVGMMVHLVEPDLNQLQKIPHKMVSWLFHDTDVHVPIIPELLIIDLTALVEGVESKIEHSRTFVQLKEDRSSLHMIVHVNYQYGNKNVSFEAGTISLRRTLYQKIKIILHNQFTLQESPTSRKLELKPAFIFIESHYPIVFLNYYTANYGQTYVFKDRALDLYDIVLLDESTLLITNLATSVMKSLLVDAIDAPFLTIIVPNYKDERMRSLVLAFEKGLPIHLSTLDQGKILSFDEFDAKTSVINRMMQEKQMVFEADPRYDAGEIYVKM